MKSFKLVEPSFIRTNLAVALIGGPKTGKSSLALLTSPDPVALITNDLGEMDVLDRALKAGRRIYRRQLQDVTKVITKIEKSAKGLPKWTEFEVKQAQQEMELFRDLYYEALAEPEIRTVVVDKSSSVHELHRVAELGKLTAVEPYHYGPVNLEFKRILEQGMRENGCDKHVFLTHDLKKTYSRDSDGKSSPDGGYEMRGYDGTRGMVDLVINCEEVDGDAGLEATIAACRKERALVGEKIPLFVEGEESGMFSYNYIYNMIYGRDPE